MKDMIRLLLPKKGPDLCVSNGSSGFVPLGF